MSAPLLAVSVLPSDTTPNRPRVGRTYWWHHHGLYSFRAGLHSVEGNTLNWIPSSATTVCWRMKWVLWVERHSNGSSLSVRQNSFVSDRYIAPERGQTESTRFAFCPHPIMSDYDTNATSKTPFFTALVQRASSNKSTKINDADPHHAKAEQLRYCTNTPALSSRRTPLRSTRCTLCVFPTKKK